MEAMPFFASLGEAEKSLLSSALSCFGRGKREFWGGNFWENRANAFFQALKKAEEKGFYSRRPPEEAILKRLLPLFEAEGFKRIRRPEAPKPPKGKEFKGGKHLFLCPNNAEGLAFYESLKKFKLEGIQAIRRGRGRNSHYSEAWGKEEGHGEKPLSECPKFSIYLKAKGKGFISPESMKGESFEALERKLKQAQKEAEEAKEKLHASRKSHAEEMAKALETIAEAEKEWKKLLMEAEAQNEALRKALKAII